MRYSANPLRRYLASHAVARKTLIAQTARILGHNISPSLWSHWELGRANPSPVAQLAIMRSTHGAVTPVDWCRYAVARGRSAGRAK